MTKTDQSICPICKREANDIRQSDYGERLTLNCDRCGKFTITDTAATIAQGRELGTKLSAWTRERSEAGSEVPVINSDMLNQIEAILPSYRVAEKQLLLLRAIERRTHYPGQRVAIDPHLDYPLAWAAGEDELNYLLHSLVERGLVRRTDGPPTLDDTSVPEVELTPDGWNFLDERARPAVISDQVFVAMAFSPELKSAWEFGIRPALQKAG